MIKCTDALFCQTSPSTFFRKPLKRMSQDKPQITDSQIIEKLQLILLSIRQQAVKAFSYLQDRNINLQRLNNQQFRLIQVLREENALQKKFLQTYIQKYGQIGPQMNALQKISRLKSQLELQISQSLDKSQTSNHSKQKLSNHKSKNEISTSQNLQDQCFVNRFEKVSPSICEQNFSQSNEFSFMESTISSFHKKLHPYQQENTKQQNEIKTQILSSQIKSCDQQISNLPEIIDDSKLIDQQLFNSPDVSQDYELGIESKGSTFFNHRQSCSETESNLCFEAEQNLLNQKEQNQTQKTYFGCLQNQNDDGFQPLKTDSDIKRMRRVLESKYSNQQIPKSLKKEKQPQKTQMFSEIQPNTSNSQTSLIKNLNLLDSKNYNFYYHKQEQKDIITDENLFTQKTQNDEIQNMRTELRLLQKKLKALFQPLPPNIVSKRIPFPRTNEELQKINPRESQSLQKLNEMMKSLQKNSTKHQIQGSQQKKRSKLNKRIV